MKRNYEQTPRVEGSCRPLAPWGFLRAHSSAAERLCCRFIRKSAVRFRLGAFIKHDAASLGPFSYSRLDEGGLNTTPCELDSLLRKNLGSIPPAITKSVEAAALPV